VRFVYNLRTDVRLEDYVCGEPHRDISGVAGVRRPLRHEARTGPRAWTAQLADLVRPPSRKTTL